jgi:hypothetical protein
VYLSGILAARILAEVIGSISAAFQLSLAVTIASVCLALLTPTVL